MKSGVRGGRVPGNAPGPFPSYSVSRWKHTRFWAVTDRSGSLVTVAVYRKGAESVRRLLEEAEAYRAGHAPFDPASAPMSPA